MPSVTTPAQHKIHREFLTALCSSMVEISVNSTFLLTGRVTGLFKRFFSLDAGFNYVELEVRKKHDRDGKPCFYQLRVKRRKVTPRNTAKM